MRRRTSSSSGAVPGLPRSRQARSTARQPATNATWGESIRSQRTRQRRRCDRKQVGERPAKRERDEQIHDARDRECANETNAAARARRGAISAASRDDGPDDKPRRATLAQRRVDSPGGHALGSTPARTPTPASASSRRTSSAASIMQVPRASATKPFACGCNAFATLSSTVTTRRPSTRASDSRSGLPARGGTAPGRRCLRRGRTCPRCAARASTMVTVRGHRRVARNRSIYLQYLGLHTRFVYL